MHEYSTNFKEDVTSAIERLRDAGVPETPLLTLFPSEAIKPDESELSAEVIDDLLYLSNILGLSFIPLEEYLLLVTKVYNQTTTDN